MLSIWEKETFFAPQDVIIAGSGFTGLWSAFYLKKNYPSLAVTILESGIIPTGASTRNAGFACFGSLSEVVHDAQVMGTDKMLELVEMRFRGLERIRKFFRSKDIDFDMCGGYELYDHSDKVTTDQLQHNIEYINSLFKPVTGIKKTYRQSDNKIDSFGFGQTRHLVKNNMEGYLHSGKLVCELLRKVQGMGVKIINHTEIKSFEETTGGVTVITSQPFELQAKKLLVCTNAFARNLLPDLDVNPARGQVLITSPIEKLPWKGTFHSDEGFYYFRNIGNRILLGGARNQFMEQEATFEFSTSELIQSALENYLDNTILPGAKGSYTIENRWSGIMGMGSEKMPIIKKTGPHVYCAVRMCGMGVSLAPVVSKQVVQMITDDL